MRKLAFALGRWTRRRNSRFALRVARRMDARSLQLVGVTGAGSSVNNLIEHRSPTTVPFLGRTWIVATSDRFPIDASHNHCEDDGGWGQA